MGKDIVNICANVPLAIRVIGGLLYGQDKSKWMSVQEFGLANLREGQNGIKPILKLSYHNLESPLKSCFSYCSLYPKDFEIEKENLISLWIAQGYVVPLQKGQSIEDASEEYFLILLRRCFFQDVLKNDFGEILSFKLHHLMHDVALEVAGKEILPSSSFTSDMDKMVRHVSLVKKQYTNYCFAKAHIRTYLHVDTYSEPEEGPIDTVLVLSNYRYLRTLDLSCFHMETLSTTIGELIHLRYLNLSHNNIEVLPNSFTKLYNLQTLLLDSCNRLKELPKDLCKLVNLRILGLLCCDSLTFMPSGMGKLTDLCMLSKFVVGEGNSSLKQHVELEGLKALKKLRGYIEIEIRFPKSGVFVKDNIVREGSYIRDKEHLNRISFKCKNEESNGAADYEEELLGTLQPHVNLHDLRLVGYRGVRMPRWAKDDNFASSLPNVVRLDLDNCSELQCLPSLGNLQYLKYLRLHDFLNLDYIESHPGSDLVHDGLSVEGLRFFPCLERLSLKYLPKLKEWWGRARKRVGGDSSISSIRELHQSSLFLPQLIYLEIWGCPELISIPHCPNVEKLSLFKFNERLQILRNPTSCPKLREVTIDSIAWLHSSLPMDSFQSLTFLKLSHDKDVESLDDFGQVFRACSFTLQTLEIGKCTKLRSVLGGLGYLAALESLSLSFLPIVNLADEEFDGEDVGDGMPWGSLCHTLRYLQVTYCKEVQSFPKWMRKLTALRQLYVRGCSERLYERCQNPNGEDWPNIQHIPIISIK